MIGRPEIWKYLAHVICVLLLGYLLLRSAETEKFDMTANGWFQIFLVLGVNLAIHQSARISLRGCQPGKDVSGPVVAPDRKKCVSPGGVDEGHEMRWTEYTVAMLLFSGVSMVLCI